MSPLMIETADCLLASAAPFAGMTQTGSMGLISAAHRAAPQCRPFVIVSFGCGRKGPATRSRSPGGTAPSPRNQGPRLALRSTRAKDLFELLRQRVGAARQQPKVSADGN